MCPEPGEADENRPPARRVSPYLASKPPILREACHAIGHDEGGRHCPRCVVREFCETQARRALLPPAED
jgi:hypothetical protein